MIDFTLTDEQLAMREMAHDFAEKEMRPVAWDYDRDATWPQDIIDKAWEIGLMNSHLPEAYGGPGLSYVDEYLAMLKVVMSSAAGTLLMAPATATVDRLVIGSGIALAASRAACCVAATSARWASLRVAACTCCRKSARAFASTAAAFAVGVLS